MAGLAAAFQENLICEEFNFCLRRDFICCVRHGVNLLRTSLYAYYKIAAYKEEGESRADSRYPVFRGVALGFARLREVDLRRVDLRAVALRAERCRRRESRVSCSME
jgi:hypothetical protein